MTLAPQKFSLEPTLFLDQKVRYLNHLHELRRINEGDDTSDAPGYALYLARIPVSVLPGKRTFEGYGAEITFTVEPNLSPELLPLTFRNLVINDVADQLALPVTRMLENEGGLKKLNSLLAALDAISWEELTPILCGEGKDKRECLHCAIERMIDRHFNKADRKDLGIDEELIYSIVDEVTYWDTSTGHRDCNAIAKSNRSQNGPSGTSGTDSNKSPGFVDSKKVAQARILSSHVTNKSLKIFWSGQNTNLQNLMYVSQKVAVSRQHPLAVPPTQIEDIYGEGHVLVHVVLDAWDVIETDNRPGKVHLPDVKAFLTAELASAYDFLSLPESLSLWHKHCTPELAEAIRARRRWLKFPSKAEDDANISKLRADFFNDIKDFHDRAAHTSTVSLAWGILVESALLNQALIDDMQRVSREKGCILSSGPNRFYLPKPLPTREDLPAKCREVYEQHVADLNASSQSFNDYVRCRWPIIVFALDPETDDQNIADTFSRRRELQLAVSVAVAQGKVSPSAAGKFVRSLETDIETISINRSAVGFSHGNDTFGWRFYPRVQTPPDVGNFKAFQQTLFGAKPYADLRKRKLEPGIRECSAVIIMPSFVPHASFTSRANWFGITNPGKKELTLHDTMELSRTFQGLQGFSQRIQECGSYRPGDVSQLTRVVQQLDRKLPLQTAMVQIPYENTVGGFEMFTTGLTDLGPELHGWYGGPGVFVGSSCPPPPAEMMKDAPPPVTPPTPGPAASGTVLFLVGNNFSVHRSRVVAGGRCVPSRMLSREIMEVVIPENALVTTKSVGNQLLETVDVHVATPYGVTSHLLIPVVRPTQNPAAKVAKVGFEIEEPKEMHLLATYSSPEKGETLIVHPHRLDHVQRFKLTLPEYSLEHSLLKQPSGIQLACGLYKDGKLIRKGLGTQFPLVPQEARPSPDTKAAAKKKGQRPPPATEIKRLDLEDGQQALPAQQVFEVAKYLLEKLNRLDLKDADEVKLELAFFLVTGNDRSPVAVNNPVPIVVHIRKTSSAALKLETDELPAPAPAPVKPRPKPQPAPEEETGSDAAKPTSDEPQLEQPSTSSDSPLRIKPVARRSAVARLPLTSPEPGLLPAAARLLPAQPGNSEDRP